MTYKAKSKAFLERKAALKIKRIIQNGGYISQVGNPSVKMGIAEYEICVWHPVLTEEIDKKSGVLNWKIEG